MIREIEEKIGYTLSKNVKVNQKIKIDTKWLNIDKVTDVGVELSDGTKINYGDSIIAWKIK